MKLFRKRRNAPIASDGVVEEVVFAHSWSRYRFFRASPSSNHNLPYFLENAEARSIDGRVVYHGHELRRVTTGHRRITLPPGAHLSFLADFFCSQKTVERIVQPIISDMQIEFCEALAEGRNAKAAWIRVRSYWSFWKALGLYAVVKNLREIWKISGLG